MTAEGRPVFISCCVAITVPHVLQFSSAEVKGYVHPEMKNSFNKALTPRTDGKSGVRVCSPQNISGASQQNSVTAFFFPKQLKQMGTCFKMEKTRGNKNIKWLHTAWLALSKSVSHFKALAALDWDPQVWLWPVGKTLVYCNLYHKTYQFLQIHKSLYCALYGISCREFFVCVYVCVCVCVCVCSSEAAASEAAKQSRDEWLSKRP